MGRKTQADVGCQQLEGAGYVKRTTDHCWFYSKQEMVDFRLYPHGKKKDEERAAPFSEQTESGQKFLPSVFTVSVIFFTFCFCFLHPLPPRLCDSRSSLRLWCLATTIKIAMNHRWLFSGPTMLHIISVHSNLLLSFGFWFSHTFRRTLCLLAKK